MMIPVWEYPDAIESMSQGMGETEATCFQIFMAIPIRLWSSDRSRITYAIPTEQAEKAGVSIDEWFESYQTLHEIGAVAWDEERKAHYFTNPEDAAATQVVRTLAQS